MQLGVTAELSQKRHGLVAVSPAPVDQLPSTNKELPAGPQESAPAQKCGLRVGHGPKHVTAQDDVEGAGRKGRGCDVTFGEPRRRGDVLRFVARDVEHLWGEVNAVNMVTGLGQEDREGACAATQVGDRLRVFGQQREKQSLPGRARVRVTKPVIGRFVERFGFVVP